MVNITFMIIFVNKKETCILHKTHISILSFLHSLCALRPGIFFTFQICQKASELISIASPGGPSTTIRILLNPKPFHIRCTLPGHILKTVIHTGLVQFIRTRISLQMLYLSPDPGPYIRK